METVITKNGVLKMAQGDDQARPDNINTYLTWNNVYKLILALCAAGYFLSMIYKDNTVDNTVRDLRVEQISTDVKNVLSTIKEMQAESKSNDAQVKTRLSTVESDIRILRSELSELKE